MSFRCGLIVLLIISLSYVCFFWWLHKSKQLDRGLFIYLSIFLWLPMIAFGYFVRQAYIKETIEDECWAYLKGRVYCQNCKVQHEISSIYADHIRRGGTSDDGWVAYVFAKKFKDGSYHDSFGFNLVLHNYKVIRMIYDHNIHPIYE